MVCTFSSVCTFHGLLLHVFFLRILVWNTLRWLRCVNTQDHWALWISVLMERSWDTQRDARHIGLMNQPWFMCLEVALPFVLWKSLCSSVEILFCAWAKSHQGFFKNNELQSFSLKKDKEKANQSKWYGGENWHAHVKWFKPLGKWGLSPAGTGFIRHI